jgi:hypothetical protein
LEIDFHSREGSNDSDSEVGEYFAKGCQEADVERALDQQPGREHRCLVNTIRLLQHMLNLSLASLPQGNCPIVRSSETIPPGTHLAVQSSKFDVIEKVPH